MTSSMLKHDARTIIFANVPTIIFISVLYIIIAAIISNISIRLPASDNVFFLLRTGRIDFEQFISSIRIGGLVLAFLLSIMLPTVAIGYNYYCLKLIRKQEGDYKDLLTGFGMFTKVVLLSLVITVLTFLWALLFFFPGLVAHYKYRQAYFILLDDPSKGVMQCINESKGLMYGRKLDLFLIDLSFIGWHFLNTFVLSFVIPFFPIVSVWLTPYYGLTQAGYYDYILKQIAT